MDKRLLTALALCFLLIWVHHLLFPPPAPQPLPPAEEQAPPAAQPGDEAAPQAEAPGGAPPGEEPPAEGAAAGEGRYEASIVETEEEIVLDTDNYRAVFSNRGGVLKSLKLKHYFTDPEVQKEPARMADPANWLEILGGVNEEADSFAIEQAGGGTLAGLLKEALWEHTAGSGDAGTHFADFTLRTGDGLVFRKLFRLRDGAYHIDFRLEIENRDPARTGALNLILGAVAGIYEAPRAAFTIGPTALIVTAPVDKPRAEPEIEDYTASSLKGDPRSYTLRPEERLLFAGAMTNYFAALVAPGEGRLLRQVTASVLESTSTFNAAAAEYRDKHRADPPPGVLQELHADALTNVRTDLLFSVKPPQPGNVAAQELLVFAGPKSTDLMDAEPYVQFYPLIEDSYGMFAWINKSLIWILKHFYALAGNWGVAIILLTFLVKIILFPFNRMQQVSMHRYQQTMSKLKPKLDELKKKFKNNKKKYNEAQMKLMKEHGATPPLAGCLLVFLQFPVFLGLFQVLRTSLELRHSPFCLWINDLSQPDALPLPFTLPLIGDSLNVVPILMTVAFFYQQKSMPKPADPQAQQMQSMMKFMPFIFLFMLYSYASGLSLYWMTSNLISIFEYRVIRRKFPVEQPAAKEGSAHNAEPAPSRAGGKSKDRKGNPARPNV